MGLPGSLQKKGILALLGCGFDPGVTSVYTAYAAKHYFDEIHELDIVDANAGSHGKAFATNFNPEINIREVTQRGKYWQNGQWVETEPHEIWKDINYPEIGPKRSYLIYHEELESLVKNFPTLKRARFWMTFSEEYLTHLRVIQNIGMAGIEPIRYKGVDIVPLQFLKAVLPAPGRTGRKLHRLYQHRLPHQRHQGRQRAHLLRLEQLLAPGCLPRNRHPGRQLHHRRARHDRRPHDPRRQMERQRRVQRGRIQPRSVHGRAAAEPGLDGLPWHEKGGSRN
jgi:hypothetical protein